MSLDEVETAVSQLGKDDLAAFTRRFEEYLSDSWDRRIEADIEGGRLDNLGRQADAEFDSGRCKPM